MDVWGNDYAQINAYEGIVSSGAFKLRLDGNGRLNMPTWRISVQVNGPIQNGRGELFPATKISLLPITTYGQLHGYAVPTISQIGMPLQSFLQQGTEVFLVPQSQAGLYSEATGGNPYYNFYIDFDLKIEGGAYLAAFTTWSEFTVPLEFRFYNKDNKLERIVPKNYRLQMGVLGGVSPDPNPQFSIAIEGNVVNGLLELKTKQDYMLGTQATYLNGLRVNANAGYQVHVKSLQGTFLSSAGNSLPLNVVQVLLRTTSGGSGIVYPVWLSGNKQKIASGNATQGAPVYYDIIYKSKPNDSSFITSEIDEYTTTLQYEITPQ